jgi:thioredoxin-like negative regulator of GroEL
LSVLLTPGASELDDALASDVVLVLGREGCVRCSDLTVVADAWARSTGTTCVLVHLDELTGQRLREMHDFVRHVDVLPAVVPFANGEPLAVLHGTSAEVLERAAARVGQARS